MTENWKIIEDFPDYMVSNQGRIESFKRYKEGRILKPRKNRYGYLQVGLWKNKKGCNKYIHRLVLENFDPRENMDKFECNHKNGIKSCNIYPENIEWCTPSENIRHAVKNGLIKKGEESPLFGKKSPEHSEKMKGKYLGENGPNSILVEKDVIEIRIDLNEGILTQKEIGKKFGVTHYTISDIKRKKTWKHIK